MNLHTGFSIWGEPKLGLQIQRKDPLFAIRNWRDETSHHSSQLWEVLTLLGPVMQAWILYSHLWGLCNCGGWFIGSVCLTQTGELGLCPISDHYHCADAFLWNSNHSGFIYKLLCVLNNHRKLLIKSHTGNGSSGWSFNISWIIFVKA